MRSAWSPARSMSLDTLFDVFANCVLASPTVFATDFGSTLGRCLGTGMPSTDFLRPRPFSAIPPAMPAAAAPTAIAGPLALPAADLTVPTIPWAAPLLLLLPLVRAGVEDRLDVVVRFAPPDDEAERERLDEDAAFARPFDDDEPDFARPFDDAFDDFARPFDVDAVERFVPPDPLVARDRVLAPRRAALGPAARPLGRAAGALRAGACPLGVSHLTYPRVVLRQVVTQALPGSQRRLYGCGCTGPCTACRTSLPGSSSG